MTELRTLDDEPGLYRDRNHDSWLLFERNPDDRALGVVIGGQPLSRAVAKYGPLTLERVLAVPLASSDALPGDAAVEEFARVRRLLAPRFMTAPTARADVLALRELVLDLATEIWQRVPEGRNRALALTALEDTQMRANRGIHAEDPYR